MTNEFYSDEIVVDTSTAPGHQEMEVPVAELTAAELSAAELYVAQPEPVDYPKDTLVAFQAGLLFVTTGQDACNLGAELDQIALTPALAWRIAAVLRATLEQADMHERSATVHAWNADEAAHMPHGLISLNEHFVQVGIEPLGAGARITVGWNYVPGLIVSLEGAADWAQGVR